MECKVCNHKHDVWDGEELTLKYTETERFLRIEGTFELVQGLDRYKRTLFACPKCGTIQIEI